MEKTEIFNELKNKSEELSEMMVDQCQEAKAGDAMKKIRELTALKDQHRQLRRQNSSKEKGKVKAPISGSGEMPAEQKLPALHLPRESLWAQMLHSGHPETGTSMKQTWTLPPHLGTVFQAKLALRPATCGR